MSKNKTYSLVLSGGGTRGAYEAGALKAFNELGYAFEAVVGTSIGAINAALLAQGDFAKLESIWRQTNFKELFSSVEGAFIDTAPMRALLSELIDEEKLRTSPCRFGLVAYNLSDRTPEYRFIEDIPPGQVVDFILASANVPIFKRVVIDGKRYVDGAVYDEVPIQMLWQAGYRNIVTISVIFFPINRPLKERWLAHRNRDLAEIYLESRESLGGLLESDPSKISRNLELGYLEALKILGRCSGNVYFFAEPPTFKADPSFLKPLAHNPLLGQVLRKPVLMGRILLALSLGKYWPAGAPMTWAHIFCAARELSADVFGLERVYLYTNEGFYSELIEASRTYKLPKQVTPLQKRLSLAGRLITDRPGLACDIAAGDKSLLPYIDFIAGAAPDILTAAATLSYLTQDLSPGGKS